MNFIFVLILQKKSLIWFICILSRNKIHFANLMPCLIQNDCWLEIVNHYNFPFFGLYRMDFSWLFNFLFVFFWMCVWMNFILMTKIDFHASFILNPCYILYFMRIFSYWTIWDISGLIFYWCDMVIFYNNQKSKFTFLSKCKYIWCFSPFNLLM